MLLWALAILVVAGHLIGLSQTGDDGFLRTRLTQAVNDRERGAFFVQGTDGFPSRGLVTVDSEVVRYSAKTPNTLFVIERGRRPRAHAVGATVQTTDLTDLENLNPLAGEGFFGAAVKAKDWAFTVLSWNYPFLDHPFGQYFRIMVLVPMNMLVVLMAISKLPIPGLKIFG